MSVPGVSTATVASTVAARRRSVLAATLLLAALNLRAAIAAVPPLLDHIEAQLHLSAAAAGVLTTLPLVCMAVFAPVAGRLVARAGPARTMTGALLVIAAGSVARLAGAHTAPLYAGTFLAGVGIAVGQTVIPSVVKQHFADRTGLMTGLYSTAMAAGATIAAAVAVPASHLFGSWQASLAMWAAPALLATVLWTLTAPALAPATGGVAPVTRLPLRSGTAWLISLYLGASSCVFYGALSWLAPLFQLHGWTATRAGYATSLFNLVGIAASLTLPAFVHRLEDRRPAFALPVCCLLVSMPALAIAPTASPWLWVTLAGFGQGGVFALGLTLLVDHVRNAADAARLSAMAFLLAYAFAAGSPVLMGYLRDVTGNFRASFLLLSVAAVAELGLAMGFTPARRHRALATAVPTTPSR